VTLILTVGTPNFVVQVSDRRFTCFDANGRSWPCDEEANKEVTIRSSRFAAVVSFTGRATVGPVPLDLWLLDVLDMKVVRDGPDACLEAIRIAADRNLGPDPNGRRYPQTFVFAGYEFGVPRPFMGLVTNCTSRSFQRRKTAATYELVRSKPSGFLFNTAGATAALPAHSRALLNQTAKRRKNYPATADAAVDLIRQASRHGKLGALIGKNCSSVCVRPDGSLEAMYHAAHTRPQTFGPNLIEEHTDEGKGAMLFRGVESQGSPGLTLTVGTSGLPIRDRRSVGRSPLQ
jgi:hypothetical protein